MKLLKYLWFRYILREGFCFITRYGTRVGDIIKYESLTGEHLVLSAKKYQDQYTEHWVIPYKKVEDKITILEEYYNKKFAYKHGIWH